MVAFPYDLCAEGLCRLSKDSKGISEAARRGSYRLVVCVHLGAFHADLLQRLGIEP